MSKSKREPKIEDYFKNLYYKQHISYVQQIGLQDTNLNITISPDIDLGIKELFLFTSDGVQLIHTKFNKISTINCEKFYSNIQRLVISIQKSSKLDNNFNFHKIYIQNLKIIFLLKSHVTVVGVFNELTNSHLIKLYLLHIYTAFTNFNFHMINLLKHKNNVDNISDVFSVRDMKNNQKEIKVFKNIDLNKYEFFQIKIFEFYFIKSLTFHFDRVSKQILKKEEMYLSSIKFKNMYVIDLHTQEIIFDMMSMRKSLKYKKYYKNEKLWQEVLFHSNNLMNSYKNSIGMQSDSNESTYKFFFVKFECTSTFPRLTFIIKFLPILKGVSIIHIYSTKKLSRNSDVNEGSLINKIYKEIDILYGTEIKNNPNIEFRYIEPTKLQEIERFFFEFYISISTNMELFFDLNHEIKYFDYTILNKIGDILLNNKNYTRDAIMIKINNYYHENIIKTKIVSSSSDKLKISNNPYYFMGLPKETYINEYFKENQNNEKSVLDVTLNLSKIEEVKTQDIFDGSFDYLNRASFPSKEEDIQQPSFITLVRAKYSNNNVNNFSQTIDNYVNQMEGKKLNGAEENGAATEHNKSEHTSIIKNAKNSIKDRSSSFNQRLNVKHSLSPVATPIQRDLDKKEYFFISPGSPKFNYEN